MKLEFSTQTFGKYTNTKFHGNPSSVSRVLQRIRTDGLTDMTKIIFTFRNFLNNKNGGKMVDIKITDWYCAYRYLVFK